MGEFFITVAHVFEFYEAHCSAVEIDSFSGSTSQFPTVNSNKFQSQLAFRLNLNL